MPLLFHHQCLYTALQNHYNNQELPLSLFSARRLIYWKTEVALQQRKSLKSTKSDILFPKILMMIEKSFRNN